jgi:hypothetical protein
MGTIGKILNTDIPIVKPILWKIWNTYALAHNTYYTKKLAKSMNCTFLEADVMIEGDFKTLQEAQDSIAQSVTYCRLLEELMPGAEYYIRNTELERMAEEARKEGLEPDITEDAIRELIRDHVLEHAELYAKNRNHTVEYSDIPEHEKEAVVWGRLIDQRMEAL